MATNSQLRSVDAELEKQKKLLAFSRSLGRKTAAALRSEITKQGIQQGDSSPGLIRSVGYGVRQRFGSVESLSFTTKRYGFILAHGWVPAHARNQIKVAGRDWITAPLAKAASDLADYSASIEADAVVKQLQFKQSNPPKNGSI